MFEDRAKVLLILPQDVLDRARVFAGEAMTKLKGPVSLQMVLRALIDQGLRRDRDRALLSQYRGPDAGGAGGPEPGPPAGRDGPAGAGGRPGERAKELNGRDDLHGGRLHPAGRR